MAITTVIINTSNSSLLGVKRFRRDRDKLDLLWELIVAYDHGIYPTNRESTFSMDPISEGLARTGILWNWFLRIVMCSCSGPPEQIRACKKSDSNAKRRGTMGWRTVTFNSLVRWFVESVNVNLDSCWCERGYGECIQRDWCTSVSPLQHINQGSTVS